LVGSRGAEAPFSRGEDEDDFDEKERWPGRESRFLSGCAGSEMTK
jgi:hypothetical protein